MWHNLKLETGRIEKTVAEFTVWMEEILPHTKMKIKLYQYQTGLYLGITNLRIKRKFDGSPESSVGFAGSIEGALEDTINYFNSMLKEDGFDELTENDVEYFEYISF